MTKPNKIKSINVGDIFQDNHDGELIIIVSVAVEKTVFNITHYNVFGLKPPRHIVGYGETCAQNRLMSNKYINNHWTKVN